MAKMYPPQISPTVQSAAEKKLFQYIREQLPNDWLVLHSLGLTTHSKKIWAEIDFVLIGPTGVYCLEVKGGLVERRAGLWYFTDRYGNRDSRTEGPFEQVQSAAQSMRGYLTERLPWLADAAVGWGVAVPDCSLRHISGPDIEHHVVYELEDTTRPFTKYIDRLAGHWKSRLTARRGAPPTRLNEQRRAAVRDELRGDFVAVPSLRARIGAAKEEIYSLTVDQYRCLDELIDNERSLLRGGAGTGKTMLAIEAATRTARDGADHGQSTLLCCRSPHLARYLHQAVADFLSIRVWDLRNFMESVIREADLSHELAKADEDDLFAVFLPDLCIKGLEKLDRFESFDVLIVDEAQDLMLDPFLDVFDALLRDGLKNGRWTFLYDPNQDVFQGIPTQGLKRLLDTTRVGQLRLTQNCRNTRPIAERTYALSGVERCRTLKIEGPQVETKWYKNSPHQGRLVSNIVRRLLQDLAPQDIVILSPYSVEDRCLREGLIDVPFPLVGLSDAAESPPALRFARISDFKGLESDAILLLDIDDLRSDEALYALYVGASRARAYLVLFIHANEKAVYDERWYAYGQRLATTVAAT